MHAIYFTKKNETLPKITFIVAQKRHHTRFYPIDSANSDKSGNLNPGVVVETGITHPYDYDYYLLSHAGLQGTSRPCHYQVLHDENNLSPDKLQKFSYDLCHVFVRCSRSVSLIPPVYYADLLCTRGRQYLHEWFLDTKRNNSFQFKGFCEEVLHGMPFV